MRAETAAYRQLLSHVAFATFHGLNFVAVVFIEQYIRMTLSDCVAM
jgi:hypothetical protein